MVEWGELYIEYREKNEDMDTWEVLDGLKNTDYIM